MTRRSLLLALAAPSSSAIKLHIGNYGLQALEVERAIDAVRRIGYDGIELCCMPDWPSDPARLDVAARRRIRASGFPIPTLIETLTGPNALDRIKAAAALAHDIAPSNPPVLQSVIGGRPADWPQMRDKLASSLEAWARTAADSRIKLAVKAHAMQAVDTPDKLLWLLDRVPGVLAIYDYGHFQLRGLGIEETMEQLLPRTNFLTVKDSKVVDGKPQYLLPGDGTIDYRRYFAKVKQSNWSGWCLVEITRQLQTQPGYNGIQASERSYSHLAPILNATGLRPRTH